MKISLLITIISIIAIIYCSIRFNMIGSYISNDGTLIEPFYLIGLSWLFLLVGIVSAITGIILFLKRS